MKPKTFFFLMAAVLLLTACIAYRPDGLPDLNQSDPDEPVVATPIPVDEATAVPLEPVEPDVDGKAGPVAPVYINETILNIMESYPIQPSLSVSGELPTPCHELKMSVAPPNSDNEIHIDVYSQVPDADLMCVQVMEPFDTNLSIDVSGLTDGTYSVFVNGELVGTFSYPG